jgi:hypothetical protein
LDLDLVVAVDDLKRLEPIFEQRFKVVRFPHSLNISLPNSDLRVQIQTDSRYLEFPGRAVTRPVPRSNIAHRSAGRFATGQDLGSERSAAPPD